MTPGMKMMMLQKARNGGNGGNVQNMRNAYGGMENRYEMTEGPMNGGYKRRSNGRFAPHNGGAEMGMEMGGGMENAYYGMENRYNGAESAYNGMENRHAGPKYRGGEYRVNEEGGRMMGFEGGYAMQMHGAGGGQSKVITGRAEGMVQGGKHLDQMTAKKWVEAMGECFPMEETMEAMKKRKCKCEPLEFWVIVNAMKSDYPKLAAKYGVDHIDFYADMAVEWLEDRDAKPGKAMNYYWNVVKHE